MSALDRILDEDLRPPPARGRKASNISVMTLRQLNASDVEALWAVPEGGLDTTAVLVKLRQHHHYLARLLAEGRKNEECSLLTGMDAKRISALRSDPAMKELIAHYGSQVDEVYINVHERLATLGLNSVAELQDRLDDDPGSFTNRELVELAELGFDRSGHGPQSKVQSNVVHTLTPEVMAGLKDELARRSIGQIRTLTQSGGGPAVGPVVEHEPVAEPEKTDRSEGEGTDI